MRGWLLKPGQNEVAWQSGDDGGAADGGRGIHSRFPPALNLNLRSKRLSALVGQALIAIFLIVGFDWQRFAGGFSDVRQTNEQ